MSALALDLQSNATELSWGHWNTGQPNSSEVNLADWGFTVIESTDSAISTNSLKAREPKNSAGPLGFVGVVSRAIAMIAQTAALGTVQGFAEPIARMLADSSNVWTISTFKRAQIRYSDAYIADFLESVMGVLVASEESDAVARIAQSEPYVLSSVVTCTLRARELFGEVDVLLRHIEPFEDDPPLTLEIHVSTSEEQYWLAYASYSDWLSTTGIQDDPNLYILPLLVGDSNASART